MLAFLVVLAGSIVLAGVLLALCFSRSCPDCDRDLLDWEYGIYMKTGRGAE